MLFWFIITPTGPEDPVRTIVTSMAAVLTASMTMRIILAVRGSLRQGGSFAVSSGTHPSRSGTTHVVTASRNAQAPRKAPGKSRSKSSKTGRSSRGSSSKKRERAVSSSEDSEDSDAIVQKKQEKRKAKAGVDAKEKERRAG